MKNTVKRGVLFLALAVLIAGGVFAQRVGETVVVGGRTYTVAEVGFDGSILLRPVTATPSAPVGVTGSGLDGRWRGRTSGTIITITGDQAVYTQIGTHALTQDAAGKGRIVVGGLAFSGINNHSPTIWRSQVRMYHFSANAPLVNTSVSFQSRVIHMSADGRSFIINSNVNNATIGSASTSSSLVDFVYDRM
ncbi:MAG: hypothetical protein FWG89_03940 [Treponema sp.]|nr:hypothetical protein [Treponema sp.]